MRSRSRSIPGVAKVSSGIAGFDEITGGGLPRGRPTLICGGPGCGKTLFGLEFLARGALRGEAGVFVSFEETEDDLIKNMRSLGYDLADLIRRKMLAVEYVRIERSEIEETGEYDLEGLFIRLDHAFRTVGARHAVLDTIESLFSGLRDDGLLRAELRRLFGWLKRRKITAIITGERGGGALTRHGLEEYVSDCVVLLDHRVTDEISTRRLRIVKYRGSAHGTNEYPFVIDKHGIAVMPITALRLEHGASTERLSTGLTWLDEMFGGRGYYRGSSVLLSGAAGTAKTSMAAHFLDAACRRGERAICFLLEESPAQYLRNMASIGLDLQHWLNAGRLRIEAARPSLYGLESHLLTMHREIEHARPSVVVIDPLSSFVGSSMGEVSAMLIRLIDLLKTHDVTGLFTHLASGSGAGTGMELGASSLMDTWIQLRNVPAAMGGGRRLEILKSRGMAHASDERPFRVTEHGVVTDAAPEAAPHRKVGGRS